MYLQALHLKSFRSYVELDLSLDAPRVLIGGVVGAGKSSVRELIRWVLTGKAQDWTGAILSSDVLAPRSGEAIAAGRVLIKDIGWVERVWRPSGTEFRVQGFTGTATAQQEALFTKMGTTEAFVQAACDSEVFLRLHHGEAKTLILRLLDVKITVNGTEYTLDDLDATYKAKFDERRAKKSTLKGLAVLPKPAAWDGATAEAIDARLTELRQQVESLSGKVGGAAGQRAQVERQRQVVGGLGVWEGKSPDVLADEIIDLSERLAIMEQDTSASILEPPPAGTVDLAFLKTRREALAKHQPDHGCVLDPAVRCDTGKINFSKRAKIVAAEIDALSKGPVEPLPDPSVAIRQQLAVATQAKAEYDQLQTENARRQSLLADLDDQLSKIPDTAALEAELAEAKRRIGIGEERQRAARTHQTAMQAHEESDRRHQALAAEVEALEAACVAFGPSGARLQALTSALEGFLSRVNALTVPFGWQVGMSLDPWGVIVNDRPIETYSRSEQYRVGIAIQLAIAKLSGVNFAIIDELDLLDIEARNLMGSVLYRSDLGQLIILATREAGSPLPNPEKVPGTRSYRIGKKDARSVILEATQ